MGTKHDASGMDAIANPGASRGARADERTPGTHRSWRTMLTVGLGGIAALVSALATLMATVSARATYYLPPPDGSSEAVERHDWIESVLALIPVSVLAGLLALVVSGLGITALVRRRETSPWLLALAGLALVIALAVLVAAPWLLSENGTY